MGPEAAVGERDLVLVETLQGEPGDHREAGPALHLPVDLGQERRGARQGEVPFKPMQAHDEFPSGPAGAKQEFR